VKTVAWHIGIEVTKRCNFRCRHCFVDAGRARPDEASTVELVAIIQQLGRLQTETIGWSGGEPLLRRDLEELTACCSELGIDTGLASNGYLASPARLAALARSGLSVLQVSIDGPTPELAERFRLGPRGAFKRAQQAVEAGARCGLRSYVCTLLAPETAGEIEQMIAFSKRLGAGGLRYTMWAPVGRASGGQYDERAWATPALRAFFDVASGYPDDQGFQVLIDCPTGPLPGATGFRCRAGSATAYLTADGDLYPCTALMFEPYRVGNLRQQPLAELFADEQMTKVLRQIRYARPHGLCGGCDLLAACQGGCPGRTVAAFGRVRGGEHQGAMPACMYRLHRPSD
jgi:radical SAM protein with 4Fe4S-binding SPASM domain